MQPAMSLIYANPPGRINSISDRKFPGDPKKTVSNITAYKSGRFAHADNIIH